MPYLNLRIAGEASSETAQQLVSVLMRNTTSLLGKKPEVTSIAVDFVQPEFWFVGGSAMASQAGTTFYLDIKITQGTNTKAQKAAYIENVFSEMEAVLGPISAASYIVIDDIGADSWGFQGRTQEHRFISG